MNDILNSAPLIVFSIFGFWLSAVDLCTHRLPNQITLVLTALLLTLCYFTTQRTHILIFASLHTGVYLLLFAISQQQFGFGDVKYSFPVGLATGFYSQDLVALVSLTFGLAAIVSLLLLFSRKLHLRSRIAFGPYMTVGAILTIYLAN